MCDERMEKEIRQTQEQVGVQEQYRNKGEQQGNKCEGRFTNMKMMYSGKVGEVRVREKEKERGKEREKDVQRKIYIYERYVGLQR